MLFFFFYLWCSLHLAGRQLLLSSAGALGCTLLPGRKSLRLGHDPCKGLDGEVRVILAPVRECVCVLCFQKKLRDFFLGERESERKKNERKGQDGDEIERCFEWKASQAESIPFSISHPAATRAIHDSNTISRGSK